MRISDGSSDVCSSDLPNMTMMVSVSGFTPSIRGIGAVGTGSAPHEEQPVATYVDGVYIAAPSAAATFGFNNIQRIEVLKGPARKSVAEGKRVSVRVDLGGHGIIKKKKKEE